MVPPSRGSRILFANLAIEAGQDLRDETLVRRMWPHRRDGDAVRALRVAVHRLRHWLHADIGDAMTVRRTIDGYALDLHGCGVDAVRFRGLAARAGTAPQSARARLLAEALHLWRGPVLVDILPEHLDPTALQQLSHLRTEVAICYARLTIDAGRPGRAVQALAPVVADDPLNEGLHAVRLEALAASGQQAGALEAYENLRVQLRDELGVEPSREVSRALMKVLRRDLPEPRRALDRGPHASDRPTPAQIPAAVNAFVGRRSQLAELESLVKQVDQASGQTVMAAICGIGGVGKTALAIHWAHLVAHLFPDGQLYIDLRGFSSGRPIAPLDAVARLLRDIGIDDTQIPQEEGEAASLYRSAIAGRRMLVLLDNAAGAEQVRPLLPGTSGTFVLVTSRSEMAGLVAIDGAQRITLDSLTPDESIELLTELLGEPTVAADPASIADLATACAHLPLALRIAAANLAGHRFGRVTEFTERLRGRGRWQALTVPGDDRATLNLTFEQSHRALSPAGRKLFSLLGLMPGAEFAVPAAAAIADSTFDDTGRAIAELVGAHMLTENRNGRFGFHDLLRAYAADLAEREVPDKDKDKAWQRAAHWYLAGADSAARRLNPKVLRLPVPPLPPGLEQPAFPDANVASEWLDAELGNLIAVAREATAHHAPAFAWLIGDALRLHLFRRRLGTEFDQIVSAALDAATSAGDGSGRAVAQLGLATACRSRGDLPQALRHLEAALEESERVGWTECEIATLSNISIIHTEMGDLDRAIVRLREAQTLNRDLGDTSREATTHNNLGAILHQSGRLADAVASFQRALDTYRQINDNSHDSLTLHNLGRALRDFGRTIEARTILETALRAAQATGDKHIEAGALSDLAVLDLHEGQPEKGRHKAERAFMLASEVGDRFEQVASSLCVAHADIADGRLQQALDGFMQSFAVARDTGQSSPAADCLLGMAEVYRLRGDRNRAYNAAREALVRSNESGFRILEGNALRLLAAIHHEDGRGERAAALVERAIALHTKSGHALGEARSLQTLRDVLRAAGMMSEADRADEQATAILRRLGAPISSGTAGREPRSPTTS